MVRYKDPKKVEFLDVFRSRDELKADEKSKREARERAIKAGAITAPAPGATRRIPTATTPAPSAPAPDKTANGDAGGSSFTAEQDQTILNMKAQGKTWAEVGAATGGDKHTAKARHDELTKAGKTADVAAKPAAGGGGGAVKTAEEKKKEGLAKAAEAKANKGKGGGAQNENKKDSAADSYKENNKANTGKKNNGAGVPELTELVALSNLADRYDRDKWVSICSKYYDSTGTWITPQRAKEIVGGK